MEVNLRKKNFSGILNFVPQKNCQIPSVSGESGSDEFKFGVGADPSERHWTLPSHNALIVAF